MKSTKNYQQFKTIEGNRTIDPSHIRKLEKSIKRANMLAFYPIHINQNMEVIDGQHRLEVAKRLELEIFYEVIENAGILEVQLLNANSKAWITQDYFDSYIKQGFPEYIILGNFMKRYQLTLSISRRLLSRTQHDRKEDLNDFKMGLFKVEERENAEIMGERLAELRPHVEKGALSNNMFISALLVLYENIKHAQLLHKLEVSGITIKRQATLKDYLRQFEDILNFKSKNGQMMRLY